MIFVNNVTQSGRRGGGVLVECIKSKPHLMPSPLFLPARPYGLAADGGVAIRNKLVRDRVSDLLAVDHGAAACQRRSRDAEAQVRPRCDRPCLRNGRTWHDLGEETGKKKRKKRAF